MEDKHLESWKNSESLSGLCSLVHDHYLVGLSLDWSSFYVEGTECW